MKKFDTKQSAQKGSLMVEAIAMLGLITMVTPILYKKAAERTTELQDINVATQMRMMSNAVDDYIKDNYSDMAGQAYIDGSQNINITPETIANYLPKGFNLDQSKMFENFQIHVNDRVIGEGDNEKHIYTTAVLAPMLENLPRQRTSKIASMIGSNGGVVVGNNATGVQGSWAASVTDYGFDDRSAEGTKNALMIISTEAINSPKGDVNSNDVLYRTATSTDEQRTMHSALYMDGNDLAGISKLVAHGDTVTIGEQDNNGNLLVKGTTKLEKAVEILAGGLKVTGATEIAGNLSTTEGGTITSAGKLTVSSGGADISGDTQLTGKLNVSGDSEFSGNVKGNSLEVTNDATISGDLIAESKLKVYDKIQGHDGLHVKGDTGTNFSYGNGQSQNNNALVVGSDSWDGDNKGGNGGNVWVSNGTTTNVHNLVARNDATVYGNTELKGNLNVGGNTHLSGNLTVDGAATFNNDVTVYGDLNLIAPAGEETTMNADWVIANKGFKLKNEKFIVNESGTVTAKEFKTQNVTIDDNKITANAATIGGADIDQSGVQLNPLSTVSAGVNGRYGLRMSQDGTSVGYESSTAGSGNNAINFTSDKAVYKMPNGNTGMVFNNKGVVFGDVANGVVNNNGNVNGNLIDENTGSVAMDTRNGIIELTPQVGDMFDTGSYIRARRFISDVEVPAFMTGEVDGYPSASNPYDYYQLNPAYTSVMNDIKLASRGGARLSDILPDYINKGVYVVDNSYKGGDYFDAYAKANGGAPLYSAVNGIEECATAGPSCQAAPWLGFIPAPTCPPNYDMAIAINPFRWRGAETYTVVQSLANGDNPIAGYKNALGTDFWSYFTRNTDPQNGFLESEDVLKADGESAVTLYGSIPTYSFQINTWFNTSLVNAYDNNGTSFNCNGEECDNNPNAGPEHFKGWHALMGYIYRGSEYANVLTNLGVTPDNDTIYWNVFPVFASDIAGYATTYCIFTYNQDMPANPADGTYAKSWTDTILNYDQLNDMHTLGTKESGAQQKLNDPQLEYNDIW